MATCTRRGAGPARDGRLGAGSISHRVSAHEGSAAAHAGRTNKASASPASAASCKRRKRWSSSFSGQASTALVPLAAQFGPLVTALGSIYIILGLGMVSIHVAFGLARLAAERLPQARLLAAGQGSGGDRAFGSRLRLFLVISPVVASFLLAEWLLVAGIVIFVSLPAGIGIGMAVAILMFIRSNTKKPVRQIVHADVRRSRKVRPAVESDLLTRHGGRIAVVELDGALFFGTAEEADEAIEHLIHDAEHVIIDFERVSEVDASGARVMLVDEP